MPNKRGKSRAAVRRPRPVRRVAGLGRGAGGTADKPTTMEPARKTVTRTARACAAAQAVGRKGSNQSRDRKRPPKQRKTSPAATRLRRAYARRRADGNPMPAEVTSPALGKSIGARPVGAMVAASGPAGFIQPDSISDGATPRGRPPTHHRLGGDRPSFWWTKPRMASFGVAAAAIVAASVIAMTVVHGARGGSSPVGQVDPSLIAPAPSAVSRSR